MIASKPYRIVFVVFVLTGLLTSGGLPTPASAQTTPPASFGFGVASAYPDGNQVSNMGFNWMLVYDPPNQRQPVKVLYRVPANRWHLDSDYGEWRFESEMYQLTSQRGEWIDAYEIGNEVNLYVNGWEAPPDAWGYVKLLCSAYRVIKNMDPTAIVVSAGLAPTGRVGGNWNNHPGHNYLVQDEREFMREMLIAGGGECADAFGYHPLGFSARFDATPDVNGGTPESNCENGFCFRGAEKIWPLIESYGYANKSIWATEMGWITEPADAACLNDYSWSGRTWQRVTRQTQAENITGAFKYARAQWPWMGAMFVFNLNFDQATYYHPCEQMRFYSIQNSETELALRGMIHEMFTFVYLPIIASRQ